MNRRLALSALSAVIVAMLGEGHALAQTRDIAKKVVSRARRALSLGPMIGGGLALASEDGADGVVSFGLGAFLFKDSVFDIGSMKDDIQKKVKKRLTERLLELGVTKQEIDPNELDKLKAEIVADVKQEIKRRFEAKPKATPNPRFTFGVEGAYLPGSEAWQIRAGLGVGISKISLGPTITVHLADTNGFALGLESGFHYLVGKGIRPLTLQFFFRYDYFVNNREVLGHQGAVGLRMMLDLL